jgi:FAD dependent oxidoreductase TIGR03364
VSEQRVAIVGAGIIGLAHAWSAAERGHRVTVFERSDWAHGASVRNFGMIWPIGQSAGEWHEVALHSRRRWLQLGEVAGVWVNPCGSLHLAHRNDEWPVLQEFEAQARKLGYDCKLLTANQVQAISPAANPSDLIGGLFSHSELCVNPRAAVKQIPRWLAERFDVQFRFSTTVTAIQPSEAGSEIAVRTTDGAAHIADRVVVCSGADFQTLFPEELARHPLLRCKLQMLKTAPQPAAWRLGPHLASGLTLRHYKNFAICPSLAALKQRVAAETPELDRYGIHVMASQNDSGEVILGDSHEYDADVEPFDKSVIDDLMLRELRTLLQLPNMTIAERWHGYYVKHPSQPAVEAEPLPNVHLCTAVGGAGMTLSLGLADRAWQRWTDRQ